MTVVMRRLYVQTHMWQKKKERISFRFCSNTIWNEFDICHCMRGNSVPLYQPLEQWPRFKHDNIHAFCVLATLCLSALVFFCKCSWYFVYLSLNMMARLCLKNERRKSSILTLSNLLQGKEFSTIFKTLRTFQDTQKSPAMAGHSQR